MNRCSSCGLVGGCGCLWASSTKCRACAARERGEVLELDIEIEIDELKKRPQLELYVTGHGLGDAIVGVYAATGIAQQSGQRVVLRCRYHDWIGAVVDEPNLTVLPFEERGTPLSSTNRYDTELREGKRRADWYCQAVDSYTPEIPSIAPKSLLNPLGSKGRVVILAPFSAWPAREWLPVHWQRLAELLLWKGFSPVAIGGSGQGERLQSLFGGISGVSWHYGMEHRWVQGAICNAHALIGVDSGPVHFAGLLQKPAIAIHSHLSPEHLFAHCPFIHSVYPESEPCAGCRWQHARGHRKICESGCSAMFGLSAADVMRTVEAVLGATV